jgi:hypothetical protein
MSLLSLKSFVSKELKALFATPSYIESCMKIVGELDRDSILTMNQAEDKHQATTQIGESSNKVAEKKIKEVEEEEEEEQTLYSFFVNEDYVEKKWSFKNVKDLSILCSSMSSTDYDLTGQIVWPASVILSWFIDHNCDLFKGKKVIELGAGCGLAGILAAKFAKEVILTDGNDIVLRLLQKNQSFLHLSNVHVTKLMWGINSEVLKLKENESTTYPDYIVGADIILWPNQLKSLLFTIRWLLFARLNEIQKSRKNFEQAGENEEQPFLPKAFISYVVRANNTTDLLFSLAEQMGFVINSVPTSSFIPEDCKTFVNLQFRLFEITLSQERIEKGCTVEDEKQNDIEDQVATSNLPC